MKTTPVACAIIVIIAFAIENADANTFTNSEVQAQGTWTKKTYNASGKWKIVEDQGRLYVELDSDFKTRSAPDLKLFLTKQSVKDVNNRNATTGSVLIAKLKSNKGRQRYIIKEGVGLKAYKSIVIHCEKYSKLWVAAEL